LFGRPIAGPVRRFRRLDKRTHGKAGCAGKAARRQSDGKHTDRRAQWEPGGPVAGEW